MLTCSGSSKRARYAIIAPIILLALIALIPCAFSGWSTTNPGINIVIYPNEIDNATTVYYGSSSYTVSQIQVWNQTAYFYLDVKNDNYPSATLAWIINGIIEGPVPTSNWYTNGWVGWALWDNGAWITQPHNYADLPVLDNGENFKARIAFNFQNETAYAAQSQFPMEVKVQLKLYNVDNNETYWTPTLDWWVWPSAYENTVSTAVADTYTSLTGGQEGNNYGSLSSMLSGQVGGALRYTFMKFPLTVPPNFAIQSAVIRYYVDVANTGTSQVYQTLTDWTENGLTYNNQGTTAATVGGNLGTYSNSLGWNTKDVSDNVRKEIINGSPYISFRFGYPSGSTADNIRTKEYGDGSYAPQLIITTAPILDVVKPTFRLLDPQTTGAPSGGNYNLLLRGIIDNLGSESYGMNFTFYQFNSSGTAITSWAYGNQTNTGSFSTPTTGYPFAQDTTYYFRLQGRGLNSGTYYWYPESGYVYGYFHDNVWYPENIQPGGQIATITTLTPTSVSETSAVLNYYVALNNDNYVNVIIKFNTTQSLDGAENITAGSISNTGTYSVSKTGLTTGTKYYYRATGMTSSGAYITGGWQSLTTGTPEEPFSIINIPDSLKGMFGGSAEAAGIFISILIMLAVVFPLAYLGFPPIGLVAMIIMFIGMFTALTWVPIWIGLVIGLGFSLLLARTISSG